ncbi:Uma2 family endonuclease [Tundrisphaera sp. TA3]|uniref:Uma2 family endonuclease n=1 Tax=Tundrisphaera sp. TA3 TaxID=3435775 RepID=UPI003EBA8685
MATPMAVPKSKPSPTRGSSGDQCVAMSGVGWHGYEAALRVRGDQSRPRLIYLDGDVFFVSPSDAHERMNLRIGTILHEIILGLRIPCHRTGQTTFRRESRRGGVEGDQTYYFANEARVRGKRRIDLNIDPPPDLAVEVVHTHDADAALEVYGRLGVPEVWVCTEENLVILARQPDGEYQAIESSLSLPFLTRKEIFERARQPEDLPELEWMEGIRRWVLDELVPRVRGRAG